MKPLVSIITACHNCEPYLKDCINSVKMQDYPHIEHLILDDDSEDKSFKVMQNFAENNPKLKIFKSSDHLKCGGAYASLAEKASGDIIAVLDADDALVEGAVSKLVDLYENNPDVGYIWTQFWYCDKRLQKTELGFSRHPGDRSMLEHGGHCFSHWRTFRRSLLDKGRIFKPGLRSAVDKWMGYALEEMAIGGFANIPLYKYRQRAGGLTGSGRKNWQRMKDKFRTKRKDKNIVPFPIRILK